MATTFFDAAAGRVVTDSLQDRTDAAGVAQLDIDGKDLRVTGEALTEGILTPSAAFQVLATSPASFDVNVGSGAVGDVAVVAGEDPLQGNYTVGWPDATTTVTLNAADLSNPRIDEIYLVVEDQQFDAGTRTLARLGYRDGTPATSPVAPGPDPAWTASLLLAEVFVAAAALEITDADITDQRVQSGPLPALIPAWEKDNATEVASVSLGAVATVASVTLNIPADWGSWKCEAWASYAASGGSEFSYGVTMRIDGVDQQSKALTAGTTSDVQTVDGAVGSHRFGITTTGPRVIALRASGDTGMTLDDIYLYARAVRTS